MREGRSVSEIPPLLEGFLRALCAISNNQYPEGGMRWVFHRNVAAPPGPSAESFADDNVLRAFLGGSLGLSELGSRDMALVTEWKRTLCEVSGSAWMDVREFPGGDEYFRALGIWFRSGERYDLVELHWQLD